MKIFQLFLKAIDNSIYLSFRKFVF